MLNQAIAAERTKNVGRGVVGRTGGNNPAVLPKDINLTNNAKLRERIGNYSRARAPGNRIPQTYMDITELPNEILMKLMGFVNINSFNNLRLTCRKFRSILDKEVYNLIVKTHLNDDLLPDQIEHTENIIKILQYWRSFCDTSVMGSGKTYVACVIAAILGLSM